MKAHRLTLRRLFDAIDYLVDDHIGIIRYVKELPREPGAPDFFHFYAQACNAGAFARQKNSASGGGASADRGTAMAKAIGEVIERYCSAIYDVEECPLTSFASAPFPCVPPDEFALYSQEQYAQPGFPYVPFEANTPVRWTSTFEAATGEIWHVPAAMVYMPYFYDEAHGESPIGERISTGLACHCSHEEAAISAICEVVERDTLTITWQAGLGVPQIEIETLSQHNQDLVDRFERTGSTVTLLNLTLDHGIPTILAVAFCRTSDAPALVFAAAADPNPEQAARKSLEELAHTRRLAHQLTTKLPPLAPGPDFKNVGNLDDHVHLYCDHANVSLAEFIFSSAARIDFQDIENLSTGDPKQDQKTLVQKINAVGRRVLLADLTTPDIGELGLSVVRAVIPGFHPLFIGHRFRALGGRRLWEVPQTLGYKGIDRATGDNPAPHPYP